jgi:D-alanyl-D-alanine carboxypeptidase/D-alanyl-D-alanine-endopeptidase (penicillin-binding protein 4)
MKNIFLLFSLFTIYSFGQTKNENFNQFLQDEQVKNALVSLKIQRNDDVSIIDFNAEKLMYPASLQKLITTKTALEVLGADFKFETNVNFKGLLEGTVFKGVIEVVGSGDPSIDEKLVNEIYEFLASKKINKIEGYLKVDQNVFDDNVPQSWLVEDVANYYGAVAYSFNYKRNLYKIKLKQASFGEKPKLLSTNPYQRNLSFDNQLISAEADAPDKAYVLGMSFSNKRRIVGSIPSGNGFFTIKGSDNNPAQTFKNELIKKFQKEQFGFIFNGEIDISNTIYTFSYSSKNLAELLKEMNQKSSNLFAEAILKTIALKEYGIPGTTLNGLRTIEQKIISEQFHFYDGSGMSRKNLINSNLLLNLLWSYSPDGKNKESIVFKNSLGISGVSGTMKYFNSEAIKGKVIGKSGSADGVLNYAGYFTDNNGVDYTFVFMINNYSGDRKALRRKMVKVLEDFIIL